MQDLDALKAVLCDAASEIYMSGKIAEPEVATSTAEINPSGDKILRRDKNAHDTFVQKLAETSMIRYLLSEEINNPLKIGDGPLDISIDPLDGSKASINGVPPGTIVGAYSHNGEPPSYSSGQIVFSSLFLYSFFLSSLMADGNVERRDFDTANKKWSIPQRVPKLTEAKTLHINFSNSRHWTQELQSAVHAAFSSGLNSRWYGSLVLSTFHLVNSAEGVFSYPADNRPGYEAGYLRLVYEAAPVSFLIKQLGGTAHDGHIDILNKTPRNLHERTPLFIGETAATRRFLL